MHPDHRNLRWHTQAVARALHIIFLDLLGSKGSGINATIEFCLLRKHKNGVVTYGSREKLASKLASGPTRAYGAVKQLLVCTFDQSLEVQLEQESRLIAEMADLKDGREGLDVFLTSGNQFLHKTI